MLAEGPFDFGLPGGTSEEELHCAGVLAASACCDRTDEGENSLSTKADRPTRVRLYHQVRTAHLERALQLAPATILFGSRRYDFDSGMADRLDLVEASGWRAAWWLFSHDVAALEVNEPLYRQSVRSTALALAGLHLGELLRRAPRARVVSYAIENLDPRDVPRRAGVKAVLARRLDGALSALVWRRLNRIVYGTTAAQDLYDRALPASPCLLARTIPAIPAREVEPEEVRKTPHLVLFLGALDERKGIRQLLEAWPDAQLEVPEARLLVLGKGPLAGLVKELADHGSMVTLEEDPPRQRVREALRAAAVLVLPSQPQPGWKEQVGLPIVEGLSYGCTVVCTTETGLEAWLSEQGHIVVPAASGPVGLAKGLIRAVRAPLPVGQVLRSLPERDGRLLADDWLFDELPDPTESGTVPRIGTAHVR